jgi:hypothetical protein
VLVDHVQARQTVAFGLGTTRSRRTQAQQHPSVNSLLSIDSRLGTRVIKTACHPPHAPVMSLNQASHGWGDTDAYLRQTK